MKPLRVAALLSAVLLAGCNMTPHDSSVQRAITADLQMKAESIQSGMNDMYQAGLLNQLNSAWPEQINANSQRISVDWDGDAVELLATLARQRGYQFVYTGTRLPLPVNIRARNMTFEHVLGLIRIQTGWRARLTQEGVELRLYFTLPDKTGRTA